LAVSLVFYPNKQAENTFWLFKDMAIKITRQGNNFREKIGEKYEKLLKCDKVAL
jgi:hypothetical protein